MNVNAVNDNNTPAIEYKEPTTPLPLEDQMPSDSRPFPLDTPIAPRYKTVSGFPPVQQQPSSPNARGFYKGRGH